ncbi:MAG: LysE family translocator [Pseudomonadota bacterium]
MPGVEGLAAFLLAAFALIGSPGPNTLSVAAVGASFGRRRGLAYMAGLNLGVALVLVITGTGVAALILGLPGAVPLITALALAYFLYLAYRIATAPPLGAQAAAAGPAPRWHTGTVVSLANPKAYAAMGALMSGPALISGNPIHDTLCKAGLILVVLCVVNLCWLSLGAGLSRTVRTPRTARRVNLVFAALLLVSVAALALGQWGG